MTQFLYCSVTPACNKLLLLRNILQLYKYHTQCTHLYNKSVVMLKLVLCPKWPNFYCSVPLHVINYYYYSIYYNNNVSFHDTQAQFYIIDNRAVNCCLANRPSISTLFSTVLPRCSKTLLNSLIARIFCWRFAKLLVSTWGIRSRVGSLISRAVRIFSILRLPPTSMGFLI